MLWHLFRAMRPQQWTKNVFVFTALIFAQGRLWTQVEPIVTTVLAFVCFSLAASSIYLINDLVDIEKDRAHPRKRNRPLASGKLSPLVAIVAAAILMPTALIGAYLLAPGFFYILLAYVVVQGFLYSYYLKNVVILDILVLATGFILRTVAGAVVLDILITPWFMVCMGLLAVFIGIGKRRHELVLLSGGAGEHRRILSQYSVPMLDQMLSIVTASIVMAYSITTFLAPAVPQEPFPVLMLTIPFVLYGIFRYVYLIYQHDGGGAPEELLYTDRPLLISVMLWSATVLALLFFFQAPA